MSLVRDIVQLASDYSSLSNQVIHPSVIELVKDELENKKIVEGMRARTVFFTAIWSSSNLP